MCETTCDRKIETERPGVPGRDRMSSGEQVPSQATATELDRSSGAWRDPTAPGFAVPASDAMVDFVAEPSRKGYRSRSVGQSGKRRSRRASPTLDFGRLAARLRRVFCSLCLSPSETPSQRVLEEIPETTHLRKW